MSWQPPNNYTTRPVVILGAGVLGRRIGYTVHIRDPNEAQRSQYLSYIAHHLPTYQQNTRSPTTAAGTATAFADLEPAVADAWLVIEAVPEVLALKVSTFEALAVLAPRDCILASNSSSYRASEMLGGLVGVLEGARRKVLNAHYYMPPETMVVELMTGGSTDEGVFGFLGERMRETGAVPVVARRESTGFIVNRLWAAVKRETLAILSEGVSVPGEIDWLWEELFVKGGIVPCRTMDEVGLDTVALIESHYIAERGLSSEHTVDYLKANFLDCGRLGNKCDAGGLYPPKSKDS